jgi:hypothetical protein
LLVGALIQAALVLGMWLPELKGVRDTLGTPALWRSANFSQGARFADFVLFLNENIPAQGRVVLPPEGFGPRALGTTPFMQFFLAPRQVINCTDPDCAQHLSTENTYLLVVESFPGEEAFGRYAQRRMFDERWGVLLPDGAQSGLPIHPGFDRMLDILLAALPPLLWMGILTLAGALLAWRMAPDLPQAMRLSLGYGLGSGALTAGLGLAWLAGAPLGAMTVYAVTLALLALSAALYRIYRPSTISAPSQSGLFSRWSLVFLCAAGFAAVLSVGQGYSVSDEILLWGAKGYGIAASGSLAHVQEWGTNTVLYPLHIPILIAAFKALFAETLPAAKLAFSGYYLALLLFAYGFLTWKGVPSRWAGLATLLLATASLTFRHATLAYANLPLAFSLVCGVVILSESLQDWHKPHSAPAFLLAGLLLSAAAWTRPEGLALALAGALALVGLAWLQSKRLPSARQLIALALPLAGYACFWFALKATAYTRPAGRGDLLGNGVAAISRGQFHLGEAAYILRRLVIDLLDPASWGVLGIALVIVAWLYLRKKGPRQPQASGLGLAGLVFLVAVLGIYYLTSYDTAHDISWWVSTGLGRMLLPAVCLLWIGLFLGTQPLDHGEGGSIPADLEDDGRLGV